MNYSPELDELYDRLAIVAEKLETEYSFARIAERAGATHDSLWDEVSRRHVEKMELLDEIFAKLREI